jgi:hypothetical protein
MIMNVGTDGLGGSSVRVLEITMPGKTEKKHKTLEKVHFSAFSDHVTQRRMDRVVHAEVRIE